MTGNRLLAALRCKAWSLEPGAREKANKDTEQHLLQRFQVKGTTSRCISLINIEEKRCCWVFVCENNGVLTAGDDGHDDSMEIKGPLRSRG